MNSTQTIIDKWEQYYEECLKENYLFPNEYVIRSFLGSYPNLKIDRNYQGKNVCDISCGDGRNIILLNKLKLNIYATEISEKILPILRKSKKALIQSCHLKIIFLIMLYLGTLFITCVTKITHLMNIYQSMRGY